MKIVRMEKEQLAAWLEEISRRADLFVPVRAGEGFHRFELFSSIDKVDFSYSRTILPPKKFLFPPEEVLWGKEAQGGYEVPELSNREIVLFGLHACDIHAIRILDIFFQSFNVPDFYYQRRRQKIRIVGHSCYPDEYCFCRSMATDKVFSGFDLFVYDLGDHCLVSLGTVEGDLLMDGRADELPLATDHDKRDLVDLIHHRQEGFSLQMDPQVAPEAMKLSTTDPIWERLGEQCLGCGSCSMGCPTCTCFNVVDRNDLEGGTRRMRLWDACVFKDFARVAGGKNFREKRSDRIRNRYYHKQVGFAEKFGRPSCVGCGRCIRMCPTGIHFVEVFRSLQEASDG